MPTSAMRRCTASTRPAARSTRRIPRSASTRCGHASGSERGPPSIGMCAKTCPSSPAVTRAREARAWSGVPRESVMTRSTGRSGTVVAATSRAAGACPTVPAGSTSASPRRTSSVAMPPLSPAPTCVRPASMSACRKSWTTVRPGRSGGAGWSPCCRAMSSTARRATAATSSSPRAMSATRAAIASPAGRSPSAATAADRVSGPSAAAGAMRSSTRSGIRPGTRPRSRRGATGDRRPARRAARSRAPARRGRASTPPTAAGSAARACRGSRPRRPSRRGRRPRRSAASGCRTPRRRARGSTGCRGRAARRARGRRPRRRPGRARGWRRRR
ncbi:hypothetical protein BC477_10355 [Clavibacter michiganensis subsp. michiganensis]|uniref:Uncharacterized protein n=1 Tax=Clavibacter michiganensis subsp. michiganensis TaxID=33013 RepID=A0A251XP07_CLAMM|nr:hypothetical protein BC477_10355 [Clavibacter michiganensis subsp. michiganensis]OUE05130.1 hypothetical protein CMMCAS07_09275 [Clavibacter michiganensis subsp. michiganensis]